MMRSVPFWVDNKSHFTATPTREKKDVFYIFFPDTKTRFTYWKPLPHVPWMQPAVTIQSYGGSF